MLQAIFVDSSVHSCDGGTLVVMVVLPTLAHLNLYADVGCLLIESCSSIPAT